MKRGETSFGQLVTVIGAILILVGTAWLVAWNWHTIPSFLKILILVIATGSAYFAGFYAREQEYTKIGESFLLIGSGLFTLAIFLIAQIFATDASIQGSAWLTLLSAIGVLIAAYAFISPSSLLLGLVEVGIWIFLQFIALSERELYSPGYLALTYLLLGGLLYGLSLVHRTSNHAFASLYKWWSFAYLLCFAYILSFQTLQPMLWAQGFSLEQGPALFFLFLSIGMFSAIVLGIMRAGSQGRIDNRELVSALGIFLVLIAFIFATALLTGTSGNCYETSCYELSATQCTAQSNRCVLVNNECRQLSCYSFTTKSECANAPLKLACAWHNNSNGQDEWGQCVAPAGLVQPEVKDSCQAYTNDRTSCLARETCKWSPQYWGGELTGTGWFIWILGNLILLGLILLILGHGTRFREPSIVNLGIAFFALDIVTRYIGFIMDLEGSLSLAFIFISGGVILIAGGWGLERWRKTLLEQASGKKK